MRSAAGALPATVTICEVGPRDGLQNEAVSVSSADKVRYIELLAAAGFRAIEVASFVSPKAVPQLADAEEVCARLKRVPGCRFIALVPNERGLNRALAARVDGIGVFTAASESFTERNIGMTIGESLTRFAPVVQRAKGEGLYVRASISTAFGCPFEGAVPVANVVRVAERLLELGADELSVADTIGVATPNQVYEVIAALTPHVPLDRLGLHFHDTRGTALANILAGLQTGVAIYDSSAGGLGGCPFAPGATGNVATEDVLYLLAGMGIETGVDLAKVRAASRFIGSTLAGRVVSRAFHALEAADRRAAAQA
jgi:isopropylmalate/homocitrate/citramalate synthase